MPIPKGINVLKVHVIQSFRISKIQLKTARMKKIRVRSRRRGERWGKNWSLAQWIGMNLLIELLQKATESGEGVHTLWHDQAILRISDTVLNTQCLRSWQTRHQVEISTIPMLGDGDLRSCRMKKGDLLCLAPWSRILSNGRIKES